MEIPQKILDVAKHDKVIRAYLTEYHLGKMTYERALENIVVTLHEQKTIWINAYRKETDRIETGR